MYLLLGDSNLRQTYLKHKDELNEETGVEVHFEQISNNESLKLALMKERDPKPQVYYISSILNEIAAKSGKGTQRETTIKNVTAEQSIIINAVANESCNTAILFLIANPMLRQEPKWIEEKLLQIKFYINENFALYSPNNVAILNEPIIEPKDLLPDKVHLNDNGKKKFYERILADLKIAKEEIEKFDSEGMEWDELGRFSQKTPKTAKKRVRPTGDDSPPVIIHKKKKDEDELKTMMKAFMLEIREDRKKTTEKTDEL